MIRFLLHILLVSIGIVLADNCTVKPLVLEIRNVTFLPEGAGDNRGVAVKLGNQLLGLRLSTILSNTRVRNPFDCADGRNIIACKGQAGGVYDPADGTFEAADTVQDWKREVLTVDPRPTDGTFVIQGFDNATFVDTDTHLPRLPLEVWANNNRPNRSALGLGRSSSLLHRLLGANLIPALPFSLDYGSRSESKYRDGQLILGGYNAARRTTSGAARFNLSAFSAPAPCPLQVLLSDVILTDHVTGVSISLFEDSGARVAACVDPLQNAFAFTPKMFEKWQRLTGWISYDGSNYSQQTYPADREARMGTLTIKLAGAGGYESVVPHWELVSHERGNDTNGVYRVLNTSRVMAAVTGGQTDYGNGVPVLGGVFLTQNYLVVDYPANEFWLSPLKEGMRDGGDDIRSFCREEVTVGGEKGEEGVGLGVKVGVPVGVVGGLAILGLVGAWVYRQREKRRTAEADAADVALEERHTEPPSPTPRPNLSPPSFISDRYLNQ